MAKINHMRTPSPSNALVWQHNFRRAVQAAEALRRMHSARMADGIGKDALWDGYYELKRTAARIVDDAHAYGRLLTCFYVD